MQTNRPPYENPPVAWPEIGAALLTVLKATWHVLRELLKLAWRVSVILVPVVLGALVNMVLWHFRNPPPDEAQEAEERHWLNQDPCSPDDIYHPDWASVYGSDSK